MQQSSLQAEKVKDIMVVNATAVNRFFITVEFRGEQECDPKLLKLWFCGN